MALKICAVLFRSVSTTDVGDCAYMYRNLILDLNKSFFSEVKQQSCRPILDKHLQTQHAPTAKQL